MKTDEFLKECLEIVAQVKTEDLEEFFKNVKESVKATFNKKNKKAALEMTKAMRDVVIAERKEAHN